MTVISLAAFKNERRAAAETTKRNQARAERESKERAAIVATVAHAPLAALLVSALVEAEQTAKRQADASRPMPAYCDPANERRGAKYEATKNLSRVEIAKRMREDIKTARKAGTIPAGVKLSVTTEGYSGGGSINIRITALPEGFKVCGADFLAWAKANPEEYRRGIAPFNRTEQRSSELAALLAALKAIHGAYNRDNSDAMSDYFDVRYYGDVEMQWELSDRLKQAEGLPR